MGRVINYVIFCIEVYKVAVCHHHYFTLKIVNVWEHCICIHIQHAHEKSTADPLLGTLKMSIRGNWKILCPTMRSSAHYTSEEANMHRDTVADWDIWVLGLSLPDEENLLSKHVDGYCIFYQVCCVFSGREQWTGQLSLERLATAFCS